jgi:hypothetical protein
MWEQGDYEEPTFNKSASNGVDDPDRPKGTAEEQHKAYSIRNTDLLSAIRAQKETEDKFFRYVDGFTLRTAQTEIHARKTQLDYQDIISSGTTGEHAVELFKKAAEQAALDCDTARRKSDMLTALAEEMLANTELRPRVPAGTEINKQRMTIINNATKSLQDRIFSIAQQD